MYAIIVESYGHYGSIVPLGKSGLQKLRNKTRKGWISETSALRKSTTGSVYVVSDFTDKMSAMTQHQLADYVMCNHIDTL